MQNDCDEYDEYRKTYMGETKTKEDALRQLEKGFFNKPDRIADDFHEKFLKLRKKIHKAIDGDLDTLDYDVYVNSILVDCRAMFLENAKYKLNSTLQNMYRSRNFNNYADRIDDFFNKKFTNDKTLKEIIKTWVDQRVVHYDFFEIEEEEKIFDDISLIFDRSTINNLFDQIIIIAISYEEFREQHGKNMSEQLDKTLKAFTG